MKQKKTKLTSIAAATICTFEERHNKKHFSNLNSELTEANEALHFLQIRYHLKLLTIRLKLLTL